MESDGTTYESDGRPTPQKDSQKVVDAGGRTIVGEGERVTGVVGVGVRAGTPGGDEGYPTSKLIETDGKRKDAISLKNKKGFIFCQKWLEECGKPSRITSLPSSFIFILYSLYLIEIFYIIEFKAKPRFRERATG